jgi:hypothetical protein
MTQAQLLELIRGRPFRPFTIQTPDGREARVDHPELIAYGGGRIAVVMTKEDRSIFIDDFMISRLEVDPKAEALPPVSS